MSLHASGRVDRNSVGELVACFGVEVQASFPAPGEEVGRVDVGPGCDPAAALHLLLGLLCLDSPGAVRSRKLVPVFHESDRRFVVVESVPDDAGNLVLFGHGDSFHRVVLCGNGILT